MTFHEFIKKLVPNLTNSEECVNDGCMAIRDQGNRMYDF
jgi:hypothetical protein